jgi:hypothetical protein
LNCNVLIFGSVLASICFSKYPRPIKGINENKDAHRYSCVSDVEDRPMEVAPQTDVNEVSDITKTEAVYEIAYSTTQNQTDRYYAQGSSWGQVTKKQQDKEQTSYANSDEKKGLIGK